jgi:hypothetical protein
MKIQCSCGAKYAFDLTPEMGRLQMVCPACGNDLSAALNNPMRQEANPMPLAEGVLLSESPAASPQVQVVGPQYCPKHPDQVTTDKCYICSKPICPKCMELFGYVCSPLCRGKANSHGIQVPVYGGQRSVREAKLWRKTARVATAVGVTGAVAIGVWFWYEWFGSAPKPAFAVRFADVAYSGQSFMAGADQIVFLHGDTLARHDMKQKKEIWSRQLLNREQLAAKVEKELKAIEAEIAHARDQGREHIPRMPSREGLAKRMEKAAAAALELRVRGQNIWVASPDKVARYDWETGHAAKEIPVPGRYGGVMSVGDEFLLVETGKAKQTVTHINLNSCESRIEEFSGPGAMSLAGAGRNRGAAGGSELAGLPMGMPGKDAGKPMDPAKVEEQARHLSYPQKLALPAVLANSMSQERTLKELEDQSRGQSAGGPSQPEPEGDLSLLPTKDGLVQFSVRLVETKIVTREAMKAPPAKSAMNGPATVANSAEMANEILNEMQRSRGGETIKEDQSRYQVVLRGAERQNEWRGEVTGPPTLFPLKTVNVLAANKTILVFDKANKKLWQGTINYPIYGELSALEENSSPYGQGPCVEHADGLYVFDEGVLTAFDLATGNVRWRYPSIGIAGLFFDDRGAVYVNTSTAGPDNIRFPRQIDITRRDTSQVVKVEAKTGKALWTAEPGGLVNYVSGKFLYTVRSYMPEEPDEDDPYAGEPPNTPPYMRIKRLDPKNGRVMWEHFQQRAPVDVQFDKNTIRLVFKKEVQVLRFLAL